jgi:uncharacterized SAM-binding protein YcdF (DUF218 family)
MRAFLLVVVIALIVIIGGISTYLQPNSFIGCPKTPGEGRCGKADAIVAISGGDTSARTESAIQLYKNGWAPIVIFSGAAQDQSGPSNAEAMRSQAINEGVPKDAIHIDEYARSTEQNAQNADPLFHELNISNIILTTSPYHQRRASLEFNRYDKDVTIRNYPAKDPDDWSFWWWTTPRGWWLASGELIKIAVFYVSGN